MKKPKARKANDGTAFPRVEFAMTNRLPASIIATMVCLGSSAVFLSHMVSLGSSASFQPSGAGWPFIVGILAVTATVVTAVRTVILARPEGWSVVIAADCLELPRAPYQSRLRERIPYEDILFVALSPGPPARPEMVIFHVGPGPEVRAIPQEQLIEGTVAEIAALVIERVTALRGPGRVVGVKQL